jgi:hypothetical protein
MQTTEAIISRINAFGPEPMQQLPVIQQEVLAKEERLEPVGEQAAVTPVNQEEQPVPASTVPGTQVLEEPTAEVEQELPALVPQEPDDSDDEAEDDDVDDEDID